MKRIICISVLLFSALGVTWSQKGVVIVENITFAEDTPFIMVEEGFPLTFTSEDKTYTIDKCKVSYTDEIVVVEIFGEGVGREWINDAGELVVLCSYMAKSNQYNLPVVCVQEDRVFYTLAGVLNKLPAPEALVFYPTGKKKNNKGIKVDIK